MTGFKILLTTILSVVAFVFTGCGTTTLQTKTDLTRTVSLTPKQLEIDSVYLRVTGTEASIVEPKDDILTALQRAGIEVVDSMDKTNTVIHLNTLFANNLKEAQDYSIAGAAGALGGAAIGVSNDSGVVGIAAGVGIALAMGVAQNAMADETYRSVSDLIIQQKNSSGEWIEIGKTRVISEAVKMGLEPSEAKPAMERQIATKVADIFKK